MTHEISIIVSTEVNRELACIHRKDLEPKLAILLARELYPWLDELLTQLTAEAQKNAKHAMDELFYEALTTVTTDE